MADDDRQPFADLGEDAVTLRAPRGGLGHSRPEQEEAEPRNDSASIITANGAPSALISTPPMPGPATWAVDEVSSSLLFASISSPSRTSDG